MINLLVVACCLKILNLHHTGDYQMVFVNSAIFGRMWTYFPSRFTKQLILRTAHYLNILRITRD